MTFATRAVPFRHNRRSACRFVLPHVAVALRGYRLGSNIARTCLVALPRSGDLFLGAERLLVATREWRGLRCRRCAHHARCSGHPNRGINGVLEIDGVVGSGLGSIARLHAIVSGAYFAQGEPEMAHNRFGFLQGHGLSSTGAHAGAGSCGMGLIAA